MSVHSFTTRHGGDEIVVTMGWDRPLQGYFMTISKTNSEDEEEHFLFNNLEQHITHPKDIEGYLFERGPACAHFLAALLSQKGLGKARGAQFGHSK